MKTKLQIHYFLHYPSKYIFIYDVTITTRPLLFLKRNSAAPNLKKSQSLAIFPGRNSARKSLSNVCVCVCFLSIKSVMCCGKIIRNSGPMALLDYDDGKEWHAFYVVLPGRSWYFIRIRLKLAQGLIDGTNLIHRVACKGVRSPLLLAVYEKFGRHANDGNGKSLVNNRT